MRGCTASAGQISPLQGSTHCKWWIEPWHSTRWSSAKPARWNWPSTLLVKTKAPWGSRAPSSRRIAKPSCGMVARYSASR
jgi:hypothetical protein